MQKQKGFSAPVLALSVWTAALAEEIQTGISPRGMIIHGAVQALLLTCISGVLSACWQRAAMQWVWLFSAGAWFLAELFGTVMQAQNICQQEFRSMALIGLLPLLLWAGWCIPPSGWDAPARVLWWFVLLGGLVCRDRLAADGLGAPADGRCCATGPAGRVFRCMREYLFWPLLAGYEEPRSMSWLPLAHLSGTGGSYCRDVPRIWRSGLPGTGTAAGMECRCFLPHGCAAFAHLAHLRDLPHRLSLRGSAYRVAARGAVRERSGKMKQKKLRSLSAVLLIGWCLIFLRCETTEKSMVRALYLAQKEQSITVGLLYQAPEAAADASEASGAVQLQLAQADTLAKALAAAQKQLPQKADYRLCDYLLIDQDASAELLAAYERTVLENRQGRVSAKVSVLEMDDGFLEELPAEKQEFPNKLLEQLKQCADQMPRLYQYQDGMLLPQLRAEKQEVALADTSILWRVENSIELEARQAETARLLLEMGGVHTFWLEGEPVTVRRCSVSVTLREETASLRLDCQRSYDTPQPSAAQCEQLAELCTQTVQSFWQQGIDLVHLQQRSALQNGVGREKITIKTPARNCRQT